MNFPFLGRVTDGLLCDPAIYFKTWEAKSLLDMFIPSLATAHCAVSCVWDQCQVCGRLWMPVRAVRETCVQWKLSLPLCTSLGAGGSQAATQQQQFWAWEAATKPASSSVQPVGGTQQGGVMWEALEAADSSHTPPSTPQMCFFSHPPPTSSFPSLKHVSQTASSPTQGFCLVAEGPRNIG